MKLQAGASKIMEALLTAASAVHLNWTHAEQVNLELVNLLGRNWARGGVA
jgi:hypothetical protein